MKKLSFLFSKDGKDYYQFKPSLFKYYYCNMASYETKVKHIIRDTWDWIRMGSVFTPIYQMVDNKIVGYGIIVNGGQRYDFCSSKDMVLCSIWIDPKERGKGYAKDLIGALIDHPYCKDKNIYAYIRHNNIPSIKAFVHNGFEMINNAKSIGFLHKVKIFDEGFLGIYKLKRGHSQMSVARPNQTMS